jgi:hypothetical protein
MLEHFLSAAGEIIFSIIARISPALAPFSLAHAGQMRSKYS